MSNELSYLSGGISGFTHDQCVERFGKVEELAIKHGFVPVNPLQVEACPTEDCNTTGETRPGHVGYLHSWECYLRYDLRSMLVCRNIIMLPEWRKSKGAMLEFEVALKTGMSIYQVAPHYTSIFKVYA